MFSMVEPQYRPSPSRSWSERIINSATGLTSQFFQSPPSNLPNNFPVKGSSSSSTYASAARDIPRRRAGAVLACDFRRLREAEEEKQREDEFRRFAESGVGSWREGEGEGMCGGYAEMQARGEEGFDDARVDDGMQSPSMWHLESVPPSRAFTPMPMISRSGWQTPSQSQSQTAKTDLWTNLDEIESLWIRSHSTAVQRLRQVQGHLTHTPTKSKTHILRPIHPLPSTPEAFQTLLQTLQSQPNKSEDPNATYSYFNCPHMDCHRRLERQNASLPTDFQMRACVHTGCGFVSRTVEEWVGHCTGGEHHQGSGEAFGGCERCRGEDTH